MTHKAVNKFGYLLHHNYFFMTFFVSDKEHDSYNGFDSVQIL